MQAELLEYWSVLQRLWVLGVGVLSVMACGSVHQVYKGPWLCIIACIHILQCYCSCMCWQANGTVSVVLSSILNGGVKRQTLCSSQPVDSQLQNVVTGTRIGLECNQSSHVIGLQILVTTDNCPGLQIQEGSSYAQKVGDGYYKAAGRVFKTKVTVYQYIESFIPK